MKNNSYSTYGLKMGIAAAALAASIGFTAHSAKSYSSAMDALNANPDYVESETLEDVTSNLSSASSELKYTPEKVWRDSYETCDEYDEEGDCISWSTHWETHRIPEDCPDPSDAKNYIQNAISGLENTGAEVGPNPDNAGLEGALKNLYISLPEGNEMCNYHFPNAPKNEFVHASKLFKNERDTLDFAAADVNAHSKQHYAKVPPNLKSDRNWSLFGIIASIFGILGSGAFGAYSVYKQKENTGFYW
ncbi:MAG: hypothetical protein WC852_06860 [Candidatus Nanoarchaeia archaeon]|jgi:hypothetical protein